jgi:hypothetical protein
MRAATKLNGFKYYEYVLIYVDDILALGEHPEKVMISLSDIYRLKRTRKLGKLTLHQNDILVPTLASTTFPTVRRHGTCPPTIMLRRRSKWWNRN